MASEPEGPPFREYARKAGMAQHGTLAPDAAPEAVERMVTAPCPRCGTIHLWDQDPRAADAAEVERLTSENARLREALAQAVVDLDACRMINEAGGIGKAYGLRSTLAKARTALGGAHE